MAVTAPEKPSPTGSFADHLQSRADVALAEAGSQAQKVQLFANGASIGWLGENGGQWCVVTGKDVAVSLEAYVWQGVTYYRNSADTSRYLSVSDGDHYVGFYNWNGATGWEQAGDVLTSLYSKAQLSYWSSDNGYVYANGGSGYTRLTVKFE